MTKFNGWTNYETWKTNLDLFDGYEFDSKDVEGIKQEIEEILGSMQDSMDNPFIRDIFDDFLSKINIEEIAEHYTEDSEDEN